RAIIMQPSSNGCEANRQPHSAGSYYNSNFNSASGGDEDCNFAKLYRAVRCGRLVASWSESELLALAPLLSWHRDRLDLAELLAACQPEANSLHFGHVLDYANSLHYSVEFDAIGHDAKVDLERRVVDKCGLIGDFVSVVWPSAASSGEFESCDRPDQQARMLLRDILVAVRTAEARGFDAFNSAVAVATSPADDNSSDSNDSPAATELADSELLFHHCLATLVAVNHRLPDLLPPRRLLPGLLRLRRGRRLLQHLAALQPAAWRSLVRQLLACGPGRPIRWALSLAELDPGQSAWLAEMCASERRYPDLLAGLLTRATPPAARPAALRRLLMHESPDTRAWFLAAVTAAASGGRQQQQQRQQSPTSPGPAFLAACRPDLLAELRSVASASAIASSPAAVILASQLVKLYAVLHCHAPTQPALTESELAALAELLTSAGPDATGGLTAVCVAFALIAYTAFNDTQQARLLAWLRRLVREPGRPDCRYKEVLLLCASHLHSRQQGQACEFLDGLLGLRQAAKRAAQQQQPHLPSTHQQLQQQQQHHLVQLAPSLVKVFLTDLLPEPAAAAHAVRVEVTPGLTSTTEGHLPAHCVLQLLQMRSFAKYKADVTGWVLRQIKECRAPLNTVMPILIEAFAKSLVQPHDKWSAPAYEVIRQTDILAFYTPSACGPAAACAPLRCFDNEGENELEMSTIERDLTPQLLMLYYVLCYVDCLFDSRLEISRSGRSVHRYDSNLLSRIPVGYLVRHCQRRPEHYRVLYPLLVRLLVLRMPHLLLTELPIQDELALSQDSCPDDLRPVQLLPPPGSPPPRPTDFVGCSAAELASGGHALAGIMTRLNWLANRKADCLIPYADWLVRLLKASTGLDGPASQLVQERLKPLWLRLYQLMPRRLALATLSALRGVSLSEETIEKDPVEQVVAALPDCAYRQPALLELCLRIIELSLRASESYWERQIALACLDGRHQVEQLHQQQMLQQQQLQQQHPDKGSPCQPLRRSLLATQAACTVQLLLERCLDSPRHVRRILATFVHSLFISDRERALCQVVHWQCYPLRLVPFTACAIPSMHICLDFILDHLAFNADPAARIFNINLMGFLAGQYRIQAALDKAATVLESLTVLSNQVHSLDEKADFAIQCMAAVLNMCKAFPKLARPASQYLLGLMYQCRVTLATLKSPVPVEFRLPPETVARYRRDLQSLTLPQRYQLCYVLAESTLDAIVRRTLVPRTLYFSPE
ncbi:hypothetical protein BOX15_Mlig015168g1, partial [Macrostomum lignano]